MISDFNTKKYITLNSQKISVWVYGDTSKYTLVFIHGFFKAFSDNFGDLPMRHLLKDYCIYTFDLPGFGYSKEASMDTSEFLDVIINTHLKGRRYVLWGNSYGGVIALKYASRNPEKLDGVIVSGTPYYYTWERLLWVIKLYPRRGKGMIGRLLYDFEFMVLRNLINIKKPVLLLYSGTDDKVNIGMGRKLNKVLKNSRFIETKGRTHRYLLHRIDENEFLKAVSEFLEKSRA